jgi:hypothetical protein
MVGKVPVSARRKNAARDKMGKKSPAWVENPPYESPRTKIPPLRGGRFFAWEPPAYGHAEQTWERAGRSPVAVGVHKAADSGWPIVQNKANCRPAESGGSYLWKRGYGGARRLLGRAKQSQSKPISSWPRRSDIPLFPHSCARFRGWRVGMGYRTQKGVKCRGGWADRESLKGDNGWVTRSRRCESNKGP